MLDSTTDQPSPRSFGALVRLPAGPAAPPGERGHPRRIRLRVASGPEAAGQARRALVSLEGELEPRLVEDLRLLVTELVTNSVRHAAVPVGDAVDVEVSIGPERVRVAVGDGGSGFVERPPAGGRQKVSGWGLDLVDQVASRWGIRRLRGTCVWFELDRGPRLRPL